MNDSEWLHLFEIAGGLILSLVGVIFTNMLFTQRETTKDLKAAIKDLGKLDEKFVTKELFHTATEAQNESLKGLKDQLKDLDHEFRQFLNDWTPPKGFVRK